MKLAVVGAAISAVLCAPRAARADSDGYYCIGPDYVAFQYGYGAPSPRPNRLYVVRVGGPGDIGDAVSIIIPSVQVQHMECRANDVRILGWTALYSVHFDAETRPASIDSVTIPAGSRPAGYQPDTRNLGSLNAAVSNLKADTVSIVRNPAGVSFSLIISADPAAVRRCDADFHARIVAIASDGHVVRERWLPKPEPNPALCAAAAPAAIARSTPVSPPPGGVYMQPAHTEGSSACVSLPEGFVNWPALAAHALGDAFARSPNKDSLKAHYVAEFRESLVRYSAPVGAPATTVHWFLVHEDGVRPFAPTQYRGAISYTVNRALNVIAPPEHSGWACAKSPEGEPAAAIVLSVPGAGAWTAERIVTDSADARSYGLRVGGAAYKL